MPLPTKPNIRHPRVDATRIYTSSGMSLGSFTNHICWSELCITQFRPADMIGEWPGIDFQWNRNQMQQFPLSLKQNTEPIWVSGEGISPCRDMYTVMVSNVSTEFQDTNPRVRFTMQNPCILNSNVYRPSENDETQANPPDSKTCHNSVRKDLLLLG